MSEVTETKREKIEGLINKIHQLRERKLLKIEYITDESKNLLTNLNKLDKILENAQTELTEKGCTRNDIARIKILIKAIEARKKMSDGNKMVLKEIRLALTFLVKEEGRLEYLLQKAMSE